MKGKNAVENVREKQTQSHSPKAQWPYLEKELFDRIENNRENGCFLSTVLIRIKVKQMAAEKDLNDFTREPSRYNWFFKRNNFTMRACTTVDQKLQVAGKKRKFHF